MKDAIHHLKHVQKKVIQSSRKSQAIQDELQSKASKDSTLLLELSNPLKRRHLNNQLRKSYVRA